MNIYPIETIPKNCRGRDTFKLIMWRNHHPGIKITQKYHKKEKLQGSVRWTLMQNFQEILAIWIQQNIKRFMHHEQIVFIPAKKGFISIQKSIRMIYINKL